MNKQNVVYTYNAVSSGLKKKTILSDSTTSKYLQTINAGEGVEKREPSCTVGGKVN